MKDPEYEALQREVRDADQRAQAARLRLWEKRGPEWWRRLGILFGASGVGYATAMSLRLFLESLEFYRSLSSGFLWKLLFSVALGPGVLLVLRLLPPLRPFMRRFDWELLLGFGVGLSLTLLLVTLRS